MNNRVSVSWNVTQYSLVKICLYFGEMSFHNLHQEVGLSVYQSALRHIAKEDISEY
jgi:hypothetical protein